MRKYSLSIPRFIIALIGLLGLVIIFEVMQPNYMTGTWRSTFICISLVLIYIGYAVPMVLNYTKEMKDGGVFIGGMIYFRGMGIYTGISVVLMLLTATTLLPMKFAVCGEIIAIFIFIIYAYMGNATDQHIVNVGAQEAEKVATLTLLKQKVMELQVRTGGYTGDRADIRDRVNKLANDLNYMSPSDNTAAINYENRMLDAVTYLTVSDMTRNTNPGSDAILREQLTEIETLYKMRKNIY